MADDESDGFAGGGLGDASLDVKAAGVGVSMAERVIGAGSTGGAIESATSVALPVDFVDAPSG